MRYKTMMPKGIARQGALAICVAALAISLLLMGTGTAQAKSISLDKAKGTQIAVYYQKPAQAYDGVSFYGNAKKGSLTNVKLSNAKVATLYWDYDDGYGLITVTPKKAGTTKLSYKWKGKKHVVTFKFVKYQNPIKSLKVGKKQYKSQFKNNNVVLAQTENAFAGKVEVTPAKNWTVTSITGNTYDGMVLAKVGKKGGKVKDADCVTVVLKNKKTKVEQALFLCNYDSIDYMGGRL